MVVFREDLIFNGAVQLSWFESNRNKANKAAEHFVFHGPQYHGISKDDANHGLVDTATFTSGIIERLSFKETENPFLLAVAGYGTGKSHLAVTIAALLEQPYSKTAEIIIENLCMADQEIGNDVRAMFNGKIQPFIVIALNGMQDFNLENEIIRQVYVALKREGLDTSILESLRPRFETAIRFCENYFEIHRKDFLESFGSKCTSASVIKLLQARNEEAYKKVNDIYRKGMGSAIPVREAEDLGRFLRVAKDTYCGPNKPFAGILIIFDEFGRYLEFSVHKPQVAGLGSLQKLFEAVQTTSDGVFMVGFIQYEIQAYIARIAPELRVDLERYVERFHNAQTVRLSTNLETLLANLLEKKNLELHHDPQGSVLESPQALQLSMKSWLPEMKNHSIWNEEEAFARVIYEGCWPLHPAATWLLYKLASIGRLLQQRSALSFVADAYNRFENRQVDYGMWIWAVDLCNDAMVDEFLTSEDYGQPGIAHKYEGALSKYETDLKRRHKRVLKAVLLAVKIGIRSSEGGYERIISLFSGLDFEVTSEAMHYLEDEYGILAWNPQLKQYEILGDAVSRRVFTEYVSNRVKNISQAQRADIFAQKMAEWNEKWNLKLFNLSYGSRYEISTRDWDYRVNYANPLTLSNQLENMVKQWRDGIKVDDEKGILVYCYVGPRSSIELMENKAKAVIKDVCQKQKITDGCPIAIILIDDNDGYLGESLADYMVLEQLSEAEVQKFGNFVEARKKQLDKVIQDTFVKLVATRTTVFGDEQQIEGERLGEQLTSLFENLYTKVIPYPFDGFAAVHGNARPDCKTFTGDLFLGNLDNERIAQYNPQQRNRAVSVIKNSWGAIDADGSVRQIPSNKNIAEIFEGLDEVLERKQRMNLGGQVRRICKPPYGCNIASAGMLIALFIGARKDSINSYKDQKKVSIEDWLSTAFKNNLLAESVLDSTEIILVSEMDAEKWERTLEKWENETTYTGRINYYNEVRNLEHKREIPQALFYRYKWMMDKYEEAKERIQDWENRVNRSKKLVQAGEKRKDARYSIRAALNLLQIKKEMEDKIEWDAEQRSIVESHLNDTLYKRIPGIFPVWLAELRLENIEEAALFRKDIQTTMKDLNNLGLQEESALLIARTEELITSLRYKDEWSKLKVDVRDMLTTQIITDSTSIITLENWIRQAKDYQKRINNMATNNPVAAPHGLNNRVDNFMRDCYNKIKSIEERLKVLRQTEACKSFKELENMWTEAAVLITLFNSKQREIAELNTIQSEIEVIKRHYLQLEDMGLDPTQFISSFTSCRREVNSLFEEPPLINTDDIYASVKKAIIEKREGMALVWMNDEVPDIKLIRDYEATNITNLIDTLKNPPKLLNKKQLSQVNSTLKRAEERASEIEVDTMLVRFNNMSSENKKKFLVKIYDFLKANLSELRSS